MKFFTANKLPFRIRFPRIPTISLNSMGNNAYVVNFVWLKK